MLKAGRYDFEIQRGATFGLETFWMDSSKTPVDLTGMTATMILRKEKGGAALLTLTSTPAAGITITPGYGQLYIAMTASQTLALVYDLYFYDLVLTVTSTSVKTRLLEGDIILT
jgi:hypothetical protein